MTQPVKTYDKEKLRMTFTTTMLVDQFIEHFENVPKKLVPEGCADIIGDVKDFNDKIKKAFYSPKEVMKIHADFKVHYAWVYCAYTYLEILNFPKSLKKYEKFLGRELKDLEKLLTDAKENKG